MEYELPLMGRDGSVYRARACGRQREDRKWEGWIEFESVSNPDVVWRTQRETTQPNHTDLVYWATGISSVFLEGALIRAMEPPLQARTAPPEETRVSVSDSIIDPFEAYEKGEAFLRRQLAALDAWHLRNVARAHRIVVTADVLEQLGKLELIELIVAHVRALQGAPLNTP